MKNLDNLIVQIELHATDGIRDCFAAGISPNVIFKGEPLIYELTSEYTRSNRFKECVKVFVEYGLEFEDNILLAVLLDDAAALEQLIKKTQQAISKNYSLRCAYTPIYKASLLHICAEFNHVSCASILVRHGLDVNIRAGIDENGFGGQTPIFHTVNQNNNQSSEMMAFLLDAGADLEITVPGIIWGKDYDWETLLPSVNPVSYAMMGLLPQMHRDEKIISGIVSILLKDKYGIDYRMKNIPNKYLRD